MKKTLIIFALSVTFPSLGYTLECPSVKALETVLGSKIKGTVEDFFEKKEVEVAIEGEENVYHHSPVLIHNLFYRFPRHAKLLQKAEGPNRVSCAYYVDPKDKPGDPGIFMHFDIEKLKEKK